MPPEKSRDYQVTHFAPFKSESGALVASVETTYVQGECIIIEFGFFPPSFASPSVCVSARTWVTGGMGKGKGKGHFEQWWGTLRRI